MDLQPVELAYLREGADLGILVALVELYERDLIRPRAQGEGLDVDLAAAAGLHPAVQAAASRLHDGLTGPWFWTNVRAMTEIDNLRRVLVDRGLLRSRSGLGALWAKRLTKAGEHAVSELQSDRVRGAAAVATFGPQAARISDPGVDTALDFTTQWLPQPPPLPTTDLREPPHRRARYANTQMIAWWASSTAGADAHDGGHHSSGDHGGADHC